MSKVPLVLSRMTLAKIFTGNIKFWDDSRIVADNANSPVATILSNLHQPVGVVVRQDSSGISMVFCKSLSAFDPPTGLAPDFSFGNTVGKTATPAKPLWCDPVTDELQIVAVSGCDAQEISFRVIDTSYRVQVVSWLCDDTASVVAANFLSQIGMEVTVLKKEMVVGSSSWDYWIGFSDSVTLTHNWYQLVHLPSATSNASVSIRTLQEGGFWNTNFNISTYYITPEIQSLFIVNSSSASYAQVDFTLTLPQSDGIHLVSTTTISSGAAGTASDLSPLLQDNINAVLGVGAVAVSRAVGHPLSGWSEYQITFNANYTSHALPTISVAITNGASADSVFATPFLRADNFPHFQDPVFKGVASGGRYTCYKRGLGYAPFTYTSASLNDMNAEVSLLPYSIGYAPLDFAISNSISYASMINKAGTTVAANSNSVSYAVMEKGGNLDVHFNAALMDGSSVQAWPMCGYNYFLLRLHSHVGNCERRQAAMAFLYDFYHSVTVKAVAIRLGFAVVPDFIRDIIVDKLVARVMCNDGSFALSKFRIIPTPIFSTAAFAPTVKTYLSAFVTVDPAVKWNLSSTYHSSGVLNLFGAAPDAAAGLFSLFSSRDEKVNNLLNPSIPSMHTNAFAHVAVAVLYRLDAFTAAAASPLRLTAEILAGIYAGSITFWNDTKIQEANGEHRAMLPHQRITAVVRSVPSDTNAIFLRFLSLKSAAFASAYGLSAGADFRYVDFHSRIDLAYLIDAQTSSEIDSAVMYTDGAVGYYLLVNVPNSAVAGFCAESDCTSNSSGASPVTGVVFPNDGGVSLERCAEDPSTVVSPSPRLRSYDLMLSTAPGCYPIAGTVDFSMFGESSQSCPSAGLTKHTATADPGALSDNRVVFTRTRLAQWLFGGQVLVKPLVLVSIAPTTAAARNAAHQQICDVPCGDLALGYNFCGYRDCSWEAGDFAQVVGPCRASDALRVVHFPILNGTTCLLHDALTKSLSPTKVFCDYTPAASALGVVSLFLCALSVVICSVILGITIYFRHEKCMRRSQLVFVYVFLSGAILLNITILLLITPNSDAMCMARPWFFNLLATVMFAPLLMKLHRVDCIFNNPKLKSIRITNETVAAQVGALLVVDVVILVLWTVLQPPRALVRNTLYPSVYAGVSDVACNTGIDSTFEIIMLFYKICLLAFGVMKAVRTWSIPSDISEAKQFAIAIYNIAIIGGIGYFLGIFLSTPGQDVAIADLLRSIGISCSASTAALVVMVPKFLEVDEFAQIFFKTKKAHGDGSKPGKKIEDDSSSGTLASTAAVHLGSTHGSSSSSYHGGGIKIHPSRPPSTNEVRHSEHSSEDPSDGFDYDRKVQLIGNYTLPPIVEQASSPALLSSSAGGIRSFDTSFTMGQPHTEEEV